MSEAEMSSFLGMQDSLFTQAYCKMHCITVGYTTPAQKYWNYAKINAWEGPEVWTGGKDYTTFGINSHNSDTAWIFFIYGGWK